MKKIHNKLWLCATLSAVALTVSACGKKDDAPVQTEPTVDAQTAVEDSATGVATANSADGIAVASADDKVVSNNDDVAIATADDAEILDGSESEEHVSTY